MVKLNSGTPLLFVKRTVAAEALRAERRARDRWASGTRRFIALDGAAEVQSYMSKSVSIGRTLFQSLVMVGHGFGKRKVRGKEAGPMEREWKEKEDLRPYLTTLLWNHGEADRVVV